jgi:hypothetical protein
MSGRVSAGRQFVVATAAATARMLQQNGHYLIFAFLHQEGGEIEYPYIPVAGSQRTLVGTVTWCRPVNRGSRLFLPPPDIEGHASGRAVG